MSEEEKVKVDVIVVGGGPAGLVAAYTMAGQGLEVVVIERGEYAGAKNVGGLLYGTVLNELIPGFYEKAPIERPVSKRSLNFLGAEEHFSLAFGSESWSTPPYNNAYIVYRSQFDKWLAGEVEEAGASILEGMVVDDLIYDTANGSKKVVGVNIRGDEAFYADIVILAEGANAQVTKKAVKELGLNPGTKKQEFAVGVKEIIGLPKERIEGRFNILEHEGVALDFFGTPFEGITGGGFIYTGKEALHIGVVGRADSLEKAKTNPNEIMDKFKTHPRIQPYLKGGELLEYSAHMIPEGGYLAVGDVCGNGVMLIGDAAGLVNMSIYKEGTNLAMASGKYAGEAALYAKQKGDFSKQTLMKYDETLRQSKVMLDLKKYRKVPEVFESAPDLFLLYPENIAKLLVDYFEVNGEPKSQTQRKAFKNFIKNMPWFRFVRDAFRARNLL